ncbi:MAG TPA: hypothetical protein VMT91_12705 [Anaerolineales bacterium]|nr:hypothetical protein [Anaerolineales bacterium]
MKTSIFLLLILLAVTACAPQQIPLSPISPIPVTSVTPVTTDIPVTTAVPPCSCPASLVTPAQPQAGKVSPDHIVCNCPVLLITPGDPTDVVGSAPQAIPASGITITDNGRIFFAHPGDSFLLNLGADTFDWTVNIDNQNVINREKNVMPIRGAQGVYQAANPGQTVLSAVGKPICQNSANPCMALAVFFSVTIIVQ